MHVQKYLIQTLYEYTFLKAFFNYYLKIKTNQTYRF